MFKNMFLRIGSFAKMWDDVYDEYVNKNNPLSHNSKLANWYMNSNFTFSGADKVTAYFVVDSFPEQLEVNFIRALRRGLPSGVSLNVELVFTPKEINWDEPALKSRLSILSTVADENKDKKRTVYNQHKNKDSDNSQRHLEESIMYANSVSGINSDSSVFYKMYTMVTLVGKRNQDFIDALHIIEKTINSRNGYRLRRVTGALTETLKEFAPYGVGISKGFMNRVGHVFGSDEILARYLPFEAGTVGRGKIYLGTDIWTNAHVYKTYKKDATDSEIHVVLSMTGGGKSFKVKNHILQLQGMANMNGTINDYEGDEYKDFGVMLAEHSKVVMLDFSQGSGRYYDPVEIRPTGIPDIDETLLDTSTGHLRALFKAVVGNEKLKTHTWASVIIEKGIDSFYLHHGITKDISTWKKSEGKTVFDVYEHLVNYEPRNKTDNFVEDKTLIIELLSSYFDRKLKANNYFTTPVSFSEISDADLVINSFNMRGRTEEELDDLDSTLIPFNASIISYIRSIMSKAKGKFNYKVWEELQRMKKLNHAVTLLKTPLSGGRKLGDINLIVSNDPAELLERDDFNLFDSVNVLEIGNIPTAVTRERICTVFNIPNMLDELEEIHKANGSKGKGEGYDDMESFDEIMMNPYSKAFLTCIDGSDYVVTKVKLPEWLAKTPLFKTGVNIENFVDSEDTVWEEDY